MRKKVIAIIGSPRGKKTASESIVNYIFETANNDKVELIKYRAHEIFNQKDKLDELMNETKEADTILISSSVFVHSIPYPLTVVLEFMAESEVKKNLHEKNMLAILLSGYPEDIQRKSSLEICRNFAKAMGMNWLGGLGFGGTPIIDGRPLEEVGGFTKWMRKSLDELRISILAGESISSQTYRLANKHFPPIPKWVLKSMMNMKLKSDFKKSNQNPYAQPYLMK